ncbi:hypothetical protein [Hymenobacter cavernae]|uniref:hypothetical protein n=1 Tax=Hymenobacter cavernae TaxID=2044852 RepID=UPI001668A6F3|nr:hypothetical protein [Hymenobacter cavernae]
MNGSTVLCWTTVGTRRATARSAPAPTEPPERPRLAVLFRSTIERAVARSYKQRYDRSSCL